MQLSRRFFDTDFNTQDCFAALNSIATVQEDFFDSLPINKSPVCRAEVAKKRARRIYLQQTMIAREETILREAQMRLRISTDQKRVVLGEGEDAALVRAGVTFRLTCIEDVLGVCRWISKSSNATSTVSLVYKPGPAAFIVLAVSDCSQVLAVYVKLQIRAFYLTSNRFGVDPDLIALDFVLDTTVFWLPSLCITTS